MCKNIDVLLTVDFDGISLWNDLYKENCTPGFYSRGMFGTQVGYKRLLDVFEQNDVLSTWFIPGTTALNFPEEVKEVFKRGHEIGHHGYDHENPTLQKNRQEEIEILSRGKRCLKQVTGITPKGYRSPAWNFSFDTVEILENEGFLYDSSLMEEDFRLKYARSGDSLDHETGLFTLGEASKVVEIPVSWLLDDFPAREFILFGVYNQGLQNGETVIQRFKDTFDYMYNSIEDDDHVDTSYSEVLTITLHPQTIGRADIIGKFEEFVKYMKSKEGVSFKTCIQCTEEFIEFNE